MYNVLCNKTYLSKENTGKFKVTADQFLTHGYQKKYVDSILFYFDWRWYGSVFLVNFVSQLPNLAINLLICEAWGYLNLYKFTCIISILKTIPQGRWYFSHITDKKPIFCSVNSVYETIC